MQIDLTAVMELNPAGPAQPAHQLRRPRVGYGLSSRIPSIDRYVLPIIGLIVVVSAVPMMLELRRARTSRS